MTYLLHQNIKHHAITTPNHIAFKSGGREITYSSFHEITNQLAQAFIHRGLQKGDRVGICLNRNIESAIAVHGILKAGGVFVPIDPDSPQSRFIYMIDSCEIKHLVTEQAVTKKLDISARADVLSLYGVDSAEMNGLSWEDVKSLPVEQPNLELLGSDLAYIMFTSGTTGNPKGIMHTHYSGLSYAKMSADQYELNNNDVIANHSPLHFDMSTLGYLTAPYVGATCIIIPKLYSAMPASMSQLIETEQISIWYSVPLMLQQMLERGALEQRNLDSLRWILFGGEPFPLKHLNRIINLMPHAQFSNVYGPAEVNQCSYFNFSKPIVDHDSLPLGFIWENTKALVLTNDNQQVRPKEIGELLIHSPTMMQGYWNNAELTEGAFYHSKHDSVIEKKYYKTGDLVYYDENGLLFFVGRKDRQVKIRGHRVELNSIEEVLLAMPQVNSAATFVAETEAEKFIVAVLCSKKKLEIENVKQSINNQLPKYALPQEFIFLDELPRTNAGKIDYKLLKAQVKDDARSN